MELITIIIGSIIGFYISIFIFLIGLALLGYLLKDIVAEKGKEKATEKMFGSMGEMFDD